MSKPIVIQPLLVVRYWYLRDKYASSIQVEFYHYRDASRAEILPIHKAFRRELQSIVGTASANFRGHDPLRWTTPFVTRTGFLIHQSRPINVDKRIIFFADLCLYLSRNAWLRQTQIMLENGKPKDRPSRPSSPAEPEDGYVWGTYHWLHPTTLALYARFELDESDPAELPDAYETLEQKISKVTDTAPAIIRRSETNEVAHIILIFTDEPTEEQVRAIEHLLWESDFQRQGSFIQP